MGPDGWPEVGKTIYVYKVKIVISDGDFFLGLCYGDGRGRPALARLGRATGSARTN